MSNEYLVKITKSITWDCATHISALVTGSRGSGKTFFCLSLIAMMATMPQSSGELLGSARLPTQWFAIDLKNSDVARLESLLPPGRVANTKEEALKLLEHYVSLMKRRLRFIKEKMPFGATVDDGSISPEVEERVTGQLKNYFRPEFLNRIDDIILFSPLTKSQITQIIQLSLKGLEKRLEDRDMHLELTSAAKDFIADQAYDAHYGARPVKRYLQKHIETTLASMIIKGTIVDGQNIIIDSDGKDLTFTAGQKA